MLFREISDGRLNRNRLKYIPQALAASSRYNRRSSAPDRDVLCLKSWQQTINGLRINFVCQQMSPCACASTAWLLHRSLQDVTISQSFRSSTSILTKKTAETVSKLQLKIISWTYKQYNGQNTDVYCSRPHSKQGRRHCLCASIYDKQNNKKMSHCYCTSFFFNC